MWRKKHYNLVCSSLQLVSAVWIIFYSNWERDVHSTFLKFGAQTTTYDTMWLVKKDQFELIFDSLLTEYSWSRCSPIPPSQQQRQYSIFKVTHTHQEVESCPRPHQVWGDEESSQTNVSCRVSYLIYSHISHIDCNQNTCWKYSNTLSSPVSCDMYWQQHR